MFNQTPISDSDIIFILSLGCLFFGYFAYKFYKMTKAHITIIITHRENEKIDEKGKIIESSGKPTQWKVKRKLLNKKQKSLLTPSELASGVSFYEKETYEWKEFLLMELDLQKAQLADFERLTSSKTTMRFFRGNQKDV